MNDLTYNITEEVIETEENFIFTTIKPWCENVIQRKISKCDLERALVLYFNGDSILDKIRADIEEVYNDRPRNYNHTQRRELFYKVIEIIDKYKAESEEHV